MEIQIQHISGSKAGLEQTFSSGTIRIGREQSNDVSFDPYRDILVSGRHAEITFDGREWVLRDLASSNGTYVGEERITVRPLKSGETIQFGRGGPQLQLNIKAPVPTRTPAPVDNPGTRVMSIDDLVSGNKTWGGHVIRPPAPEGTMMMSARDLQAARAQASPATAHGARRPASPLRIVLLVVALAFFVGILGVVVLKPGEKPQTAAATSTGGAAASEVERLRQQLADATTQLAELQRTRGENSDTSPAVTEDLERQYVKARATIDALQQELERKNDEVRAAAEKPAKVVVRYIPAPQPPVRQPAPEPVAQVAQVSSTDAAPPVQETRAYEPPRPLPSRNDAPAVPRPRLQVPAPPLVAEPAARQPARRAVAESSPPQPLRTASQPIATTVGIAPSIAEPPPLKLAYLKRLRRRVVISGVASEIPFPDAPRNLPTELAKSIGAALVSSSEFFVDRQSGSSVRVTPTLFRSVEKKSDSNAVVSTIKGLGGILGKSSSVPVPVRAKSVSYDTALSAQVTVETSTGRVLARLAPSSSLTDRRSSFAIVPAKTAWGELLNRDSPQSDVFRSVIGQAVDDVMRVLVAAEPEISVKSVRGQVVTLDAGRNANIAPDDVFDVLEGEQAIGRVRVESVQEATAVCRLLGGDASVAGKRVKYAGTDIVDGVSAIPQATARSATIRTQTDAREAPGTSFKTVSALRPGTRTTYLYSVGSWSKVKNGESAVWVPTSAIEVN